MVGWVADRFELDLAEASDPDTAAERARGRDRQLVLRVQQLCRDGAGRWAGAPEGLRRRWIADGLQLAADRWRSRLEHAPPASRLDPTDHPESLP